MAEIEIRPYRVEDLSGVRSVCFEKGYLGEPVDWLWRDRDSFADLITRYYTDQEPESAFVAELDGRVVGYLTGCVDSNWVRGVTTREIRLLVRRGAMFWPGVGGFLWRSLFDIVGRGGSAPEAHSPDRPPPLAQLGPRPRAGAARCVHRGH